MNKLIIYIIFIWLAFLSVRSINMYKGMETLTEMMGIQLEFDEAVLDMIDN